MSDHVARLGLDELQIMVLDDLVKEVKTLANRLPSSQSEIGSTPHAVNRPDLWLNDEYRNHQRFEQRSGKAEVDAWSSSEDEWEPMDFIRGYAPGFRDNDRNFDCHFHQNCQFENMDYDENRDSGYANNRGDYRDKEYHDNRCDYRDKE